MNSKTKFKYDDPEMSIVVLGEVDIITTSDVGNGFEGEDEPLC